MTRNPSLTAGQESRLNEVLAAYLEAVESGKAPDPQQWLRRYPDLAGELAEFFANHAKLLPGAAVQAGQMTTDMQTPTFGDYELLNEIARGGMGVVYRARQRGLNRVVALKMILAHGLPTPNAVRRFRIEAEAVASLDHPHIVPIYEIGEREGHHYFSMKLVEGGSLKEHVGDYLNKPREAVQLVALVARAVHHAHLRGILHRDLKPGNILLDDQRTPHVTDFGLAKRVASDGQASQSEAIVGTANYMAPEQAMAKDGAALTTAADVYSLGAILFELLTGRPPFLGESYFDTLIKLVQQPAPKPSSLQASVDRDLDAICGKCLKKESRERYDSAAALADDLDRWLAGRSTRARPLGASERFWRWGRRNPVTAALGLLVLGAVFTLGAIAAVEARHLQVANDQLAVANTNLNSAKKEAEDQAEKATLLAAEEHNARAAAERARRIADDARKTALTALQGEQQAHALAAKQREENRTLLVRQLVANGAQALEHSDLSAALVWFGEALNLDKGDPKRELNHRVRLAAVMRRFPRLVQVWFSVREASFSPNGRLVLLIGSGTKADDAGLVRLADPATGKDVMPPLHHPDGVSLTRFSPDGKILATVSNQGKLRLWDVATGKPRPELRQATGTVQHVAFSPDGKRLLTGNEEGAARLWEVATGKPLLPPWKHEGKIYRVGFTSDGKRAFSAGSDGFGDNPKGMVRFWDAVKGVALRKIGEFAKPVRGAALSSDDQRLFTVHGLNKAFVWDTVSGKQLAGPLPRLPGKYFDSWFAADGRVTLTGTATSVQLSDPLTGKALTPPLLHAGDLVHACFSPDGRAVLTSSIDRTARVWDAATGLPLTPPLRHNARVLTGSFSADGRRVLTVCAENGVRVWEIPSREQPPLLTQLPTGQQDTEVSPDGKLALALTKAGKLRVWNVVTGKEIALAAASSSNVVRAAFSPEGSRLAIADKETLRVWELEPVKAVARPLSPPIKYQGDKLLQLRFSPNGSCVAALCQEANKEPWLRIWNASSGEAVASTKMVGKTIVWEGVALSPDGRRAVSPKFRQSLQLFDLKTRQLTGPLFKHGVPVVLAAFSADGHRLVTAGGDGAVRVWDVSRGELVAPALAAPQVIQLAISHDGQRLATAARDGTVRVWDADTGQPLTLPLTPGEPLRRLIFSREGDRLLMTSVTGQVRVWELRPAPQPTANLVRLTQVLAGQRLHAASGGLMPLGVMDLRQAWKEMGGN